MQQGEVVMKKTGIVIIVLLVCCILGISIFLIGQRQYKSLPEVKVEDVEYLNVHGENVTELKTIEEFLKNYNLIYNVKDDDNWGYTTPEHIIDMQLKSGTRIIINDGWEEDFAICVRDKDNNRQHYCGKQDYIFKLLLTYDD